MHVYNPEYIVEQNIIYEVWTPSFVVNLTFFPDGL